MYVEILYLKHFLVEEKINEELEKKPEQNNAMAEIVYWN